MTGWKQNRYKTFARKSLFVVALLCIFSCTVSWKLFCLRQLGQCYLPVICRRRNFGLPWL